MHTPQTDRQDATSLRVLGSYLENLPCCLLPFTDKMGRSGRRGQAPSRARPALQLRLPIAPSRAVMTGTGDRSSQPTALWHACVDHVRYTHTRLATRCEASGQLPPTNTVKTALKSPKTIHLLLSSFQNLPAKRQNTKMNFPCSLAAGL